MAFKLQIKMALILTALKTRLDPFNEEVDVVKEICWLLSQIFSQRTDCKTDVL